jgi:hypothetical protein
MFLAWSFIAIIEMISLLNYLYQLIKFVYNLEHYKEILIKEDVLYVIFTFVERFIYFVSQ